MRVHYLSGLHALEGSGEEDKLAKKTGLRENETERWGWRNALRSNGCLETVVKETASPLASQMSYIYVDFHKKGSFFLNYTFFSHCECRKIDNNHQIIP